VPAVYSAFLAADVARDTFGRVRLAVSGAAALTDTVQRDFATRFGVTVQDGYGLTEASPIVSTTAVDHAVRAGSIGPSLPGVEVRLVADDGDDALIGDPGEIWVRGANVFAGYWDDPEQTAAVLTADGWLRTGDIARIDDGFVTLLGRSDDVINRGGELVYPADVEDVLLGDSRVREAVVVGQPDAVLGEVPVAFVIAVDDDTDADSLRGALIERVTAELPRQLRPVEIEIVRELPRAATGKVQRARIRASLAEGHA
jgi:long-chain acyl-CoA synthetase